MQLTSSRLSGAIDLLDAARCALLIGALGASIAVAQGPARTSPSAAVPAPSASSSSTGKVVTLDRIVAIVNDEVITQYEMEDQKRLVISQLKRQGTELPPNDVLEKQLLERLINERAQLQWAKDTGIRIDDAQVERAVGRIAEDNKLTQAQFLGMLKDDNIPFARFREDLRNEMEIGRASCRERVSVLV